MNSKKFKTVAIVLLLIAVVYLGYTVFSLYLYETVLKKQNAQNMADLLNARGYEINVADIPLSDFTAPVYESESIDSSFFMDISAAISGSTVESANLLPDGIRIKCRNGDVWLFKKNSYFEYISAEFAQNNYSLDIFENAQSSGSSDYKDAASDFLTPRVSQVAHFSLETGKVLKSGDLIKCVFNEYLSGYPVISGSVEAVFYGGKIIYAAGNHVFAGITKTVSAPLYDQFNILLKESKAEDENAREKKKIKEVFPCFSVHYSENTGSFFTVPSWCIVYENGNKTVYNAVNCEKTSTLN